MRLFTTCRQPIEKTLPRRLKHIVGSLAYPSNGCAKNIMAVKAVVSKLVSCLLGNRPEISFSASDTMRIIG